MSITESELCFFHVKATEHIRLPSQAENLVHLYLQCNCNEWLGGNDDRKWQQ